LRLLITKSSRSGAKNYAGGGGKKKRGGRPSEVGEINTPPDVSRVQRQIDKKREKTRGVGGLRLAPKKEKSQKKSFQRSDPRLGGEKRSG